VLDGTTQRNHIVPLTHLATDITNGNFARYNFIVPDLCHDMHSDSLCTNGCTSWSSSACWTEADKWLDVQIGALLNTNMFQPGGSGLLIITFDESVGSDTANGGGHVAWVAASPLAKPGYQSTTLYQHQSTLRLMLEGLGVALPNGAATAPVMNEFFK
jgi:acid phosphatase